MKRLNPTNTWPPYLSGTALLSETDMTLPAFRPAGSGQRTMKTYAPLVPGLSIYTRDRQVSSPLREQTCPSAQFGILVLSAPRSSVYRLVSRGTNLGQGHADARSRLYSRLAQRSTPSGYYVAVLLSTG